MNRNTWTAAAMLILAIPSCTPTPSPTTQPPATEEPTTQAPSPGQCVDFRGYPDNHSFGNPFTLSGFTFTGAGTMQPFVNFSGAVGGLQFDDAGLTVDLPGPVSRMTMEVASFTSSPIDIAALDSTGSQAASASVPGNSGSQIVSLTGAGITQAALTGGGNEGVLFWLCTEDLETPPTPEPGVGLCTDFSTYADNHSFGNPFTLNGVTFTGAGSMAPFVNQSGTATGLQYDTAGLAIDFPSPVSTVTMLAGGFYPEDITVTALDSGGNQVDQEIIVADNTLYTITLTGAGITSLSLVGGGNEGLVVWLCTEELTQPPSS